MRAHHDICYNSKCLPKKPRFVDICFLELMCKGMKSRFSGAIKLVGKHKASAYNH